MPSPAFEITTVAERPHLAGAPIEVGGWSEFMRHNRVSEAYFWRTLEVFPETCLIATAADGSVVGEAHAAVYVEPNVWVDHRLSTDLKML